MTEEIMKLSESFLEQYKSKDPGFGFNGLGYIVYKRTYARKVEGEDRTEEWWETVRRAVEGAQAIGAKYTKPEMERIFDYVFNLKGNFAGRMLWQFGTPTVERYGGASLLNCWFTSMKDYKDFGFVFDNLMLGGGMGFSVRREDIHELPRVNKNVSIVHERTNDADFIVPDSREGWVALLQKIMDAYLNGGESFTYSTILIRGSGEPIKGFGGTASGPQILIDGMKEITDILDSKGGRKLNSIDVLDIVNLLGKIVVSGNVRRSAEIAIGDSEDIKYIKAKRWDLGSIPNHRAMSNNSIEIDEFNDDVPSQIWAGYKGNGEPYGFVNMRLAKKFGRLSDGPMNKSDLYPTNEDNAEGFNPCAEITLGDGEACNLCELYLNRIDTLEEAIDVATLFYKTQKAVWNLDFAWEKTRKIVKKNRRIGLGITGVCQSMDKLDWLDKIYLALREYDTKWSKEQDVPRSIKLTTVKPSGTLSLLAGSTPGVHPAYARYYIRRVRMSSSDALVEVCRKAGLHVEYAIGFDGKEDHTTQIVSFPCEAGDNAILAKDMTAIEQLELVKRLQSEWSDNAVSVTVYYKPEELTGIQEWLTKNYKTSLKSVSFLLHNEHGFHQSPYEEITKEDYEKQLSKVDISFYGKITTDEAIESMECETGACPIK